MSLLALVDALAACRHQEGFLTVICRTPVPFVARASRALLYGASVFLSFFLMLVFMTYNVRAVIYP